MAQAPISLQNNVIAYSDDRRATFVRQPLAKHPDAVPDCVLGIVNFSDDDSVHAGHLEYHPEGDEILFVLEGRLLVAVDSDGATEEAVIESGQAFIVPQAGWHSLRVLEPGRLLFFTPSACTGLRADEIIAENSMRLQK